MNDRDMIERAPERIWLDADAEAGDVMFPRCFENPKYCIEPPVEYVRADLFTALQAERDALRETLDRMHKKAIWLRGGQAYREFARFVEKGARAALQQTEMDG